MMKGYVSTVEVRVEGMGCRRCIREVTARLRDIDGVQALSADAQRSLVRLTGSIATAEIVEALAGTPYGVDVSHETARSNETDR
jgi:copper chaperone CopZ